MVQKQSVISRKQAENSQKSHHQVDFNRRLHLLLELTCKIGLRSVSESLHLLQKAHRRERKPAGLACKVHHFEYKIRRF